MKPKQPNPARPSSPVMKPASSWAAYDRRDGRGEMKSVRWYRQTLRQEYSAKSFGITPVLVLDMSPAGQEWLVEEMGNALFQAAGYRGHGHYDSARAILGRLLSAQRQAKGGKGR